MTDPTSPDASAGNTAHSDPANAKTRPGNSSSWSRLRKPAVWVTLGAVAMAGVSAVALARYGGWHGGRDDGRFGYSERYDDSRYERGRRYGRDDNRPNSRSDDDGGPGRWYRGSGRQMAGLGLGDFNIRWVDRALSEINVTDEQRTKIRGIVRAARNDIEGIRDRVPNTRKATIELLAKPTIDRAALEALHVERLKLHDELSKRLTQAIADAAEVLTPDQRADLAKMATRRWDDRHR